MLFKEINKAYTETVKSYLDNDWTINAGTMGGSQGEIAIIDLTLQGKIISIYMESFIDRDHIGLEGIRVVVGAVTDPIKANIDGRGSSIIWLSNLKTISEIRFYQIGRDKGNGKTWYGTCEEAAAANQKSYERYKANKLNDTYVFPESAHKTVLPFVKKQKGYKTAKLSDIKKVYSKIYKGPISGKVSKYYYVSVKNGELRLK